MEDGGTITRLLLTISEVSVHKAAPNQTIAQSDEEVAATESEETDTAGWITVMNEPQTVAAAVCEREQITRPEDPGRRGYTQIRLKIDWGPSRSMALTTPLPSQVVCSN